MSEMPLPCEQQGYIVFDRRLRNLVVTHRATWLNNRGDPSGSESVWSVAEREKGI